MSSKTVRLSLVISCSLLLSVACEKDEIAVEVHQPGDALEQQIAMGQDYRYRLFFDFETNGVVSSHVKTAWDLGFESAPKGFRIVLNSAKGMAVHRSEHPFEDPVAVDDLDWKWDAPSGNLDSTAIGAWTAGNYRYVVDRGYDQNGDHQGYGKLVVVSVSDHDYRIEYGALHETVPQTVVLFKDTSRSLTYFSFDSGVLTIAPEKQQWDLVFTQYTHLFSDPPTPYVVTGVLLNRYGTMAGMITDRDYTAVTYQHAANTALSAALNRIGYDWKQFDFDSGSYTVLPGTTYVVRTATGMYYKMRFLDFHSASGEKGFPTFEFQQL